MKIYQCSKPFMFIKSGEYHLTNTLNNCIRKESNNIFIVDHAE